eukprot:TRINITY_DN1501_c0_g3_i1.p2 TRINITY_DN1501_c0_g3~~TRINITY_DN1501_c0_g3_i1.p2  ORF type:complete len:204 (+),score=43.92 TRINITY_DN1501_c0_g3_i1:113-724(+)
MALFAGRARFGAASLRRHMSVSASTAVEWKRGARVVAPKPAKAKAEEPKEPRKLLSFGNFMKLMGAGAAACGATVIGCKKNLDFREAVAAHAPDGFAKIREWFTTGKLRSEMTIWELYDVRPRFEHPETVPCAVRLQSGKVVVFDASSSWRNDKFCAEIEQAVRVEMGESWSLVTNPVVDVSFLDEEQKDTIAFADSSTSKFG